MKKMVSVVWAVVLMLAFSFSANVFAEGKTEFEYDINEDNTITITACSQKNGVVIIPSTIDGHTVSGIKNGTFAREITGVDLPDTIKDAEGAFSGCSITTIKLSPEHKYLEVIDDVLFSKLDRSLIFYPSTLRDTEYKIPEGIISVGSFAFSSNEYLEHLEIPNTVKFINESAFEKCTALTYVNLPESTEHIGSYAFEGCSALQEIKIPGKITEISSGLFSQCTALQNIEFNDNITDIHSFAFQFCTSLESLTLPDGILEIGSYAFEMCNDLTLLELPESLLCIEEGAFYGCFSLDSLELPSSVTSLETAFYGSSIINLKLGNANNSFMLIDGVLFSFDSKTLVYYCGETENTYEVPAQTETICRYAFSSYLHPKTVLIHEGVTQIGRKAFMTDTELVIDSSAYLREYAVNYGYSYKYAM